MNPFTLFYWTYYHQHFQVCKVTLLVKSSLKRHLLNKHGIQDFEFKEDGCPYCMEMYDNLTVLKEHIRKEHENDEREYFCDVSDFFV